MYAKIFRQIYDGTLAEDWRALVTFQQLLILSDDRGVIDMTPGAIHRVTGIPMDIIEPGLKKLQEPDPHSRSATEDGRRIVPVDPTRPWGWRIINFVYYRNLASLEEKREKDRQRIAEKRRNINGSDDCREVSQPVADSREPSEGVANVAHTDTNTDTEQDLKHRARKRATPPPSSFEINQELSEWARDLGLDSSTVKTETEKFLDHHRSKGSAFKDWSAAWRKWMRNAKEWAKPGGKHETHRPVDNSAIGKVRQANAAARAARDGAIGNAERADG